MKDAQRAWILVGYELFAQEGPKGLKVEVIAKKVGKNKSSFYHHFVDMDIFTSFLLDFHLERSKIIAEEERRCQNVDPELFEVLLKNKQDLLFNRQLRIHRQNAAFESCFMQVNEIVAGAITGIWAQALGLSGNSNLANMVLELSIENFYLQITEDTLTFDWLQQYLQRLQNMVQAFDKKTNSFP